MSTTADYGVALYEFWDAIADLAILHWSQVKHKPVVSGGVTFTDVEARRWLIYWYLWSAQSEVSFDIRTSDNDAHCWKLKLTSGIPWLPLLNELHCACASQIDGTVGPKAGCFLNTSLSLQCCKNYSQVLFWMHWNFPGVCVRGPG